MPKNLTDRLRLDFLASYPVGTQTVCFVNPLDPSDAVLTRGDWADFGVYLIAPAFAGLGLLGLAVTATHHLWLLLGRPRRGIWRPVLGAAAWLLQPWPLWIMVILVMEGFLIPFLAFGIMTGNVVLVVTILFMMSSAFWIAWNARPRQDRQRSRSR
jgi:hypothetical protein